MKRLLALLLLVTALCAQALPRYSDIISDRYGNVRPAVSITIKKNGSLATIYSNVNGTATASNPLTTDSNGRITFYAPNGTYTLHDSRGNVVDTVNLFALPTSNTINSSAPGQWYVDDTNPDGAGQTQFRIDVPNTVSMTGGGGVQGVGLIFSGETSAQTPNSGLAETNMIRMAYAVNSDAGSKVQVHLINGLLTIANDEAGTGNESSFILGTTRATGPTSGTAAVGAWGADFHVEKSSGVLDGSMVGLEVGVHKAPALGSAKNIGIDVWSGDRSGITATRAGDAMRISGGAGWTNFLKFLHTDNATNVLLMDYLGNTTITAPTGNLAVTAQTNANNTTGTFTVSGKTSGGTAVNGIMQAQSGGQVSIGASTNQDVVLVQNNTEAVRIDSSQQTSFKGKFGYTTGAGGAVTQASSRSTGVTVNKPSMAITLVSAAGSASPTTFTVTNSAVAATDTPICVQKSGTDKYHVLTTNVSAGTFDITFYTTGGTTVEQPVFNCNVIKGASS